MMIKSGRAGLFFFILLLGGLQAHAATVDMRIGPVSIHTEVKSFRDMKFRNMVRQNTDYSCGAAGLATILTYYYGDEVTEEEVLETVLVNADEETLQRVMKTGLSLLDLKNFAESLGYRGKGYRLDREDLVSLERPAIALVTMKGYHHFVVIKGIMEDRVFLADPAQGNISKGIDDFMEMWNGIVLVFENKTGEKAESPRLVAGSLLPESRLKLIPRLADSIFAIDPSEF